MDGSSIKLVEQAKDVAELSAPLVHTPLVLMIIIGLLGGYLSWVTSVIEKEDANRICKKRLFKHLITGLLATFMVPLFLQMIGSNLLKVIAPTYAEYYVFLGICSAAAYVAQRFAGTISEKLIKDVATKAEHAEVRASKAENQAYDSMKKLLKVEGSLHMLKKEYDLAVHYMTEYLKIDNKDSGTFWRRAYCLKRLEKLEEAIKDIDLAIQHSTKPVALLHFNKACYLALSGANVESVISSLETAFTIDSEETSEAVRDDLETDFALVKDKQEFIDFLSAKGVV